jgi:UDP-N-acetylglucosamine diphosphorylase / glucose-1-phosphate thymidylyltransferase / UDP-N-acetylgalactosamine diphosphorylase / glucosamine-1-phosphate N-acetyltransferase / galactosamine-1-phosphate N-acetyltransferase
MERHVTQPARQLVLICGGRGTRLRTDSAATLPKSMTEIAGEPIVRRLIRQFQPLHSAGPGPIVIVAQGDELTPGLVREQLGSRAVIVEQAKPDGVANAILLAAPHLLDQALVLLGDVVLEGTFSHPLPSESAVCLWDEAPPETTRENFGVTLEDGTVAELIEKPAEPRGLQCGIGVYALQRACIEKFIDAPINPVKGEREITESLRYVMHHGFPLGAFHFSGAYVNINRLVDRSRAEEVLSALTNREKLANG